MVSGLLGAVVGFFWGEGGSPPVGRRRHARPRWFFDGSNYLPDVGVGCRPDVGVGVTRRGRRVDGLDPDVGVGDDVGVGVAEPVKVDLIPVGTAVLPGHGHPALFLQLLDGAAGGALVDAGHVGEPGDGGPGLAVLVGVGGEDEEEQLEVGFVGSVVEDLVDDADAHRVGCQRL